MVNVIECNTYGIDHVSTVNAVDTFSGYSVKRVDNFGTITEGRDTLKNQPS